MYLDEYKTFKSPKTGLTIERVRHYYIPKEKNYSIKKPENVAEIFEEAFDVSLLPEEYMWALGLDVRGHALGVFEVVHGSSDRAFVEISDIFKRLLLINAIGFIIVHNHPSGVPTPSKSDEEIAKRLIDAGELLRIKMADFMILCNEHDYFSFRTEGLLKEDDENS